MSMQVWDKDTTLYQAILKPQTPLMLRNPGFLSSPARRRLFQGRGQRWKERQRREQEPFEGRRKYNPAVILSELGGGLPMENCKRGT